MFIFSLILSVLIVISLVELAHLLRTDTSPRHRPPRSHLPDPFEQNPHLW